MEECEVLCTRLAIMVNGHFKCLGSIQHLKDRFGEGYSITVRTEDHQQEQVLRFFRKTFPDAVLKEKHLNMLQYELKSQNTCLSYVFAQMETAREKLPITDYSVCQNTLDNVFINFAKQQADISQITPTRSISRNQSEEEEFEYSLVADNAESVALLEPSSSRLEFMQMNMEC